jgi:hypothetical protein
VASEAIPVGDVTEAGSKSDGVLLLLMRDRDDKNTAEQGDSEGEGIIFFISRGLVCCDETSEPI